MWAKDFWSCYLTCGGVKTETEKLTCCVVKELTSVSCYRVCQAETVGRDVVKELHQCICARDGFVRDACRAYQQLETERLTKVNKNHIFNGLCNSTTSPPSSLYPFEHVHVRVQVLPRQLQPFFKTLSFHHPCPSIRC